MTYLTRILFSVIKNAPNYFYYKLECLRRYYNWLVRITKVVVIARIFKFTKLIILQTIDLKIEQTLLFILLISLVLSSIFLPKKLNAEK